MEAKNHYVYDYEGVENALEEFACYATSRAEADALAQEHYPDMLDNMVELTVDGVTVFEDLGTDVYSHLLDDNTVCCLRVSDWISAGI